MSDSRSTQRWLLLIAVILAVGGSLWLLPQGPAPALKPSEGAMNPGPGPGETMRPPGQSGSAAADSDRLRDYDARRAMNLSGELVPREVSDYYFIEISDADEATATVAELKRLLRAAHAEQDYLGVIAENAQRMRELLLQALDELAGADLSGAVVIVVGRPQDEAALRGPVEATGAQFRFARYGGSGGPVLEAV